MHFLFDLLGLYTASIRVKSLDDIFNAALLLFEMASLEEWPKLMYAGIDATGVDMAPLRDAHPAQGLFFVAWILLGSFLLLDLFVGTLVSTYEEIKTAEEQDGALLTDEQREWVEVMERLVALRPKVYVPCPTDPTTGAVCGGAAQGTCTFSALTGLPKCKCKADYFGWRCQFSKAALAERTETLRAARDQPFHKR